MSAYVSFQHVTADAYADIGRDELEATFAADLAGKAERAGYRPTGPARVTWHQVTEVDVVRNTALVREHTGDPDVAWPWQVGDWEVHITIPTAAEPETEEAVAR